MILAIFLATGLIIASNAALLFIAQRYFEDQKAKTITAVMEFAAGDGTKPSQLAVIVDSIADSFGKHIVGTLKATFMGMQSVDARNAKRLEGDMMQDIASQASPILGALVTQFPAVARRLAKSPELFSVAQGLIGQFMKPSGNNHHTETPPSGDFGQRLNSYGGR